MKNSPAPVRPALRSPRRAFTLIEILVVIAIIGILSAILFPVFGRARENARKTACASNLKQLGIAFAQYQQDSRGQLPLAGQHQRWFFGAHWVTGGQNGTPQNFTNTEKGLADAAAPFAPVPGHEAYPLNSISALSAYTKSAGIYVCPSANDASVKKLSYSMNCALAGLSNVKVRQPGDIVLLVDEGTSLNDGYFWATDNTSSTDTLFDKHNGGGNLLYMDGHVKFYKTSQVPNNFKYRLTGTPRFHDRSFGSSGGSGFLPRNDPDFATNDACGRPLTDGPPPTT